MDTVNPLVSPDFVMIAQDLGFPGAFATERNTGGIAEGGKAPGESRDKRGHEMLVRHAG